MKKLYFGRPVSAYARGGSTIDQQLFPVVQAAFPNKEILDPGEDRHEEGYAEWKKKCGNGMQYFYQEVLPLCDVGIFLTLRDGRWTAGCFGEAKWFSKNGFPIWQITHTGIIAPTSIDEITSACLNLSIEETIELVLFEDGTPRVY